MQFMRGRDGMLVFVGILFFILGGLVGVVASTSVNYSLLGTSLSQVGVGGAPQTPQQSSITATPFRCEIKR